MNDNARSAHFGLCMGNRAGWKSIRVRLEKYLPETVGGKWEFIHLEDHSQGIRNFTKRLGKFEMAYDVFVGRTAVREAIRRGATRIILSTYHNCPWLPHKPGVRYFIYGDATMKQLSTLGYSHTGREVSRMGKLIYGRGVRRQAEAGHHFFCWSNWYSAALQAEHGVKPGQITIIPPMVDTSYWCPRTGERAPGPLRVVFVGADFMRKGGDVMMEVAGMPEFSQVEWHIVTKSPPQTRLTNVTCYEGFNSDALGLRNLVQRCDVLVLPTRADCSPIVVIEASACGIPVIATRLAGIPEEIEDGASGLLLDKPTVEHLAGALRKYMTSPELLATHGRAARQKISKEFDVRMVLDRIRHAITTVQ